MSKKNDFIEKTERLKHELKIETDSDVAQFLGMAQSTFAGRKQRNSFPDQKLINIVAANKDKYHFIDIHWVLTGLHELDYESSKTLAFEQLDELPKSQQHIVFNLIKSLHKELK